MTSHCSPHCVILCELLHAKDELEYHLFYKVFDQISV